VASFLTSSDIFKHDLAEHRDNPAILFDRYALDDHILPHNSMRLIYFRLAGFGDDMHTAVFHRIGAMTSDLVIGVDPEKFPVGFIEMGDIALFVRYEGAIVDAVKNKPIHFQLL
jgi:hypothetical protein